MKKMENSFAVTGFVGKDASIHHYKKILAELIIP